MRKDYEWCKEMMEPYATKLPMLLNLFNYNGYLVEERYHDVGYINMIQVMDYGMFTLERRKKVLTAEELELLNWGLKDAEDCLESFKYTMSRIEERVKQVSK